MEQGSLKKLEGDLQNLTQQTTAQAPSAVPATSAEPPTTTPPAQTPPISVPPETKKGSPLTIIAIVSVVVALISATAYLVGTKYLGRKSVATPTPIVTSTPTSVPTATPDPTADWEIYTSQQYGYSFKMPPGWKLEKEEFSAASSQINPLRKISKAKFSNQTSTIEIFYEGDWDHGFEPWVFEKKETINLGGKDANHTILGLEGKSPKWHIISIESFNNFRIEASIGQSDSQTFDETLSTFKFLGASPTPSASPQL